jgi:transposase
LEEEDRRRQRRERLIGERTQRTNRIKGLLMTQGIRTLMLGIPWRAHIAGPSRLARATGGAAHR